MANGSGLDLSVELIVQGLIGFFVVLWALKDAVPAYRAMKNRKPADPMATAMSIVWDRDERERFLQLMERMMIASETQARQQTAIADQQHADMNSKIDSLMRALQDKEDRLNAMISSGGHPRRRS